MGSRFGTTVFILEFTAVTVAFVWRITSDVRQAALPFVSLGGAAAIEIAVKDVMGRPNPERVSGAPALAGHSFPSGHATGIAATSALVLILILPYLRRRAARLALVTSMVVAAVAVAGSRVVLNHHWFSDIVAGLALGSAWTASVYWAAAQWRLTNSYKPRHLRH